MKKIQVTCVMLFLNFLAGLSQSQPPIKLVILHTNDLHSHLNGFTPESEYTPLRINDDRTVGGFARIATLITEERKKSGESVLVLDAGDFLMGTFFHQLEESTGFQLSLMKKMGYDMVTLGNHEWDFGPQVLASILDHSRKNGPIPGLVASNVDLSGDQSGNELLVSLFNQQVVKPYAVMEKDGLKIGFFGLLGKDAINDSHAANPVKFGDPLRNAKKYVRILREKEKVDLVICLSHSGVVKDKNGTWTGEDVDLARKVPGIDVIISGHTHTVLEKPIIVNGVPIVQTGCYGARLGRLELEVRNGKASVIGYRLIPVNDSIPCDPKIQQEIAAQERKIDDQILQPLSLSYTQVVTETAFPVVCDEDTLLEYSNLGELIVDALYSYVNRSGPDGTDIAMFAAGMVRDNILPGMHGKQSVSDIFRVAALGRSKDGIPGYPLCRVYVTGKELKGIMEILYLAKNKRADNYIYYGGLKATFNPKKGLLKKITSISVGNDKRGYVPVDWSSQNKKLYSITGDTYLMQSVGLIRKLSHGLVKVKLKDRDGKPISSLEQVIIDSDPSKEGIQEIKEWLALIWYLQQQPDTNGNGVPDIPVSYRTGYPRLFEK